MLKCRRSHSFRVRLAIPDLLGILYTVVYLGAGVRSWAGTRSRVSIVGNIGCCCVPRGQRRASSCSGGGASGTARQRLFWDTVRHRHGDVDHRHLGWASTISSLHAITSLGPVAHAVQPVRRHRAAGRAAGAAASRRRASRRRGRSASISPATAADAVSSTPISSWCPSVVPAGGRRRRRAARAGPGAARCCCSSAWPPAMWSRARTPWRATYRRLAVGAGVGFFLRIVDQRRDHAAAAIRGQRLRPRVDRAVPLLRCGPRSRRRRRRRTPSRVPARGGWQHGAGLGRRRCS